MTQPEKSYWRVVLETHDLSGQLYNNHYRNLPAATAEEAIDFALERLTGASAGERMLAAGWRVMRAWAVPEVLVEEVDVEPIVEPVFRRRVAQ